MHPMLADSLLTGLLVVLFCIFTMLCTLVALAAIVPAALARLRLAVFMAAPACACSIFNVVALSYFQFWGPDAPPRDKMRASWEANGCTLSLICYSVIPLALSLFVAILALICSRLKKPVAK